MTISNGVIAERCLFRHYGNPALCEPLNPAYISLHGMDGKGGRVATSNVPEDYRGLLLADSPAREDLADVYTKLDAYARSLTKQFEDVRSELRAQGKTDNEIRIKSLYLWSESPGTGKTTSAIAIMNEYLVTHFIGSLKRKESPKQRPVYFLDANALQTEYNAFNRPRVPEDIAEPASRRYYDALEYAKYTEFVVVDDLATRSATEGFRSDLHSVINERVTNKRPTVYTSNVPIEQLEDVFGERRLVDRIRDMTMAIHFDGVSKRGARK